MSGTTTIGYRAEGPGNEEHDHRLWKIIRMTAAFLITCGFRIASGVVIVIGAIWGCLRGLSGSESALRQRW
jgi:hypothetical protein